MACHVRNSITVRENGSVVVTINGITYGINETDITGSWGCEEGVPENLTVPQMSGIFTEGEVITASDGTWTNSPTAYQYQWIRIVDGIATPIDGAITNTYILTSEDVGNTIQVSVIATNASGSSIPAYSAISEVVQPALALKAGTLTNPPFSMALSWEKEPSTSHRVFVNEMYNVDPFVDEGSGELVALAMFNLPAESDSTGHWRLTWDGAPNGMTVQFPSNVTQIDSNRIEFDYIANGSNIVRLGINSGETPTNIRLVHQDDWAQDDLNETFRNDYLDFVRNERILRFKDWNRVRNYAGTGLWASRAQVSDTTYNGEEGIPYEVIFDLCNLVGADPWICIPHTADDDYITQLATLALAELDINRHIYIEYTNKYWDFNLTQAHYCQAQGEALWGGTSLDRSYNFYGGRSAEIAELFRAVWTGTNDARFHAVIQVWTDNNGNEADVLNAPLWVADEVGRTAPHTYMTEYAVHGLVDGGLGSNEPADIATVQGWIDTMTDAQLFDRMALACRNNADVPNAPTQEGRTLERLIEDWAYHKSVADSVSLPMIMYEGGSHMVTPPDRNTDPVWNQKYSDFHYSPQFGAVWGDVIDAFYAAGGILMNKTHDVSRSPTQHTGLVRYLGDVNPQYTEWLTQEATRTGPTDRSTTDFIGTYDLA